jgi:hypothetical protein
MRKVDGMPVKGEYYTASGKMLRAAEFADVKSFGGFKRPARIVMKNMLTPKRWSEMLMTSFNAKVSPPPRASCSTIWGDDRAAAGRGPGHRARGARGGHRGRARRAREPPSTATSTSA